MHFDTGALHLLLANLFAQKIRYDRNPGVGKVSNLDATEPSDLANTTMDCSGFVQYVIYKASLHGIRIPAGSSKQRSWCKDNKYERVDYASEAHKQDNCVRIGFRKTIVRPAAKATATSPAVKKKKLQVGHVWLVINGKTYESTTKKGNNGPASLIWSDRTADADYFYYLGRVPSFHAQRSLSGYF